MKTSSFFILIFTYSCFTLFSCSPTKTLKENQHILYKQKIKGNENLSSSELTELYQQETNQKFFGTLPLVAVYNLGVAFYDSSKVAKKKLKTVKEYDKKINEAKGNVEEINELTEKREEKLEDINEKLTEGNFLMRIGEPPVVYDSSLINRTRKAMQYHLLANGFFYGNVITSSDTSGKKKVEVTYHIKEGPYYTISDLRYDIKDRKLDSLIQLELNKKRTIKPGERFEEAKLSAERERILRLLKSNGYYNFPSGKIHYRIDTTTSTPHGMIVEFVIESPDNAISYPVYHIQSVVYQTNKNVMTPDAPADTVMYKGITFIHYTKDEYSEKLLDKKIRMLPGNVYDQSKLQSAQLNLASMDIYSYVNVNVDIIDTAQHLVAVTISVQTLKKFQVGAEIGLNVVQSFEPGPFFRLGYKERNTFGGFEIFEINLRASIAGQAPVLEPTDITQTEEYNLVTSLTFPRLYFPSRLRLRYQKYRPLTRVFGGYTIVRRPEYERGAGSVGLVYSVTPSPLREISFSPIDINLINTANISDTFQVFLEDLQQQGNNLINSFQSSYVSDMYANYIFSDFDPAIVKKAKYTRYFLESGGTLFNFIKVDSLFGLQTFSYLKGNTDYRYYFPVNRRSTLAVRVNVGAAYPLSNSSTLPYEKYFFAGGTNSIRAWQPRRLGPGSYAPVDEEGEINYRFERPGELLLETSLEYRFPIIGFFEGAAFIDAGNVWMLTEDKSRPGSELKPASFISEIAVGSGFGLRLNLSFLILRLDFGVKVYDPALKSFVPFTNGLSEIVYNIGIGYPF